VHHRIEFTRHADSDSTQAYEWYEAQEEGAGRYFSRRLIELIELIDEQPLSFPASHRSFRKGLMKNFPYAVYFQICGDKIVIAAIIHGARNPRLTAQLLRRPR
jgi:toxin ParE1/3/4